MYQRRITRPKPLRSTPSKWVAPTSGWISNRALSSPESIEGPGAFILDNFFPRATGVVLRRGKERYATLVEQDRPVTALFTYRNGDTDQLFGANDLKIYDLSQIDFPFPGQLSDGEGGLLVTEDGDNIGWTSTDGLEVAEGYTGGDWSVIQFATTGGVYLIGVNGQDTGFIYDGTRFYPNVAGGVTQVNYDGLTDDFTAGEVITGGTSGATGTLWRQETATATTGQLFLTDVTGTFVDDEEMTGATTGVADVIGAPENAVPGMDFGAFTSADMSFVWSFKNRLWFIQKESLSAWYMPVDQVGGAADEFPMGGIFSNGGSLLFGARWSLEGGASGGLSDQNVFVTTAGETSIYQGSSPNEASTWSLVGVYRVGTPLGKRAYLRGGGDLAIATTVGLVPLSKAISLDVTALSVATISYNIADAWTDAIRLRGQQNWQAMIWPEEKLAAIGLPDTVGGSNPAVFISNTETGAWSRYTNWQAYSFEVYRGQLFFGSEDGKVFRANVGGFDDGETYTGSVVPLFNDMGSPASLKVTTVARAVTRSTTQVNDRLDILSDFNLNLPVAPDATPVANSNTWGSATWGTAIWGSETPDYVQTAWRSAGVTGYRISPCYQVTSGSVSPLDVELIEMTTLHTTATAVS